jgi:hypothetical protein
VKDAEKIIFQRSAQRLAHEMTNEVVRLVYQQPESPNYKRTGFLRDSLMASTNEMPLAILDNPGASDGIDWAQIELVINGAEIGDTIYLGYTAAYGVHVHYGTNNMPPRPWVTLVSQRWQQIVNEVTAEVKAEAGL